MRPVLVSDKLSISTYVVKRLKMGLLLEMNGYDFEIGFTHWRSLFSLYTQYTQWESTVLESVRKAFSRQWDGDVLVSQLRARAQAVKECVIIENEELALRRWLKL